MLIVNADDFGMAKVATDNIALCYQHGRITSTTAMVFMEDSRRAAEVAGELVMNVGLHVNFTQSLTGRGAPERLRDYHAQISTFLNGGRFRPLVFNPALRTQFEYVFLHQFDEFVRLYGRQPTHVDGHHHMHLCANMILQGIIPVGTRVRTTFTFGKGERNPVNRLYRLWVARHMSRRYRTPRGLFSLSTVMKMQDDRAERLQEIAHLASLSPVELMTHPQWREECDYLMSEEYARIIANVQISGYASL